MKCKCKICGTEMLDQSKGPYIHFVCPKCGNAYASYDYTKDDPIKFDETIYQIKLIDNEPTIKNIKIISKMSGLNYIKCKEIITDNQLFLKGKARELIENLKELSKNEIHFKIFPEFPYKY